jgi:F0F1-type ATP synthase alpha subunit
LDQPINGKDRIKVSKSNYSIVDVKTLGIIPRQSVSQLPLTGTNTMDNMILTDRGQHELIIRDKQIKKTTIAIDTILDQLAICFQFDVKKFIVFMSQ